MEDRTAPSGRAPRRTPESAVAALWSRAHALSDGLVTEDGRMLTVVYPGRPNARAGPDFMDAVLQDDSGRRIVGDVELHVDAPDWYGHRHHLDPAYNGVVLHVVLRSRGSAASRQQSGTETPVAALTGGRLDAVAAPPPSLGLPGPRGLDDLLDRAGADRFIARSDGFRAELASGTADQVLYRALMEALGYASNRKPFRRLASLVPISALFALKGEPPRTREACLRAMLLSASGMLSLVGDETERREMRRLAGLLPSGGAMSTSQWRTFRVRPANHPLRRIEGAALLFARFAESGLASALERQVAQGSGRPLTERLAVPSLIGRGRTSDMVVNVVLPFMHAYGGVRGSEAVVERSVRLYEEHPALPDNEVTAEMKRLLGAPAGVSSAMRQQGLLHMYRQMGRRTVRETAPRAGALAQLVEELGHLDGPRQVAAPLVQVQRPLQVGDGQLGPALVPV